MGAVRGDFGPSAGSGVTRTDVSAHMWWPGGPWERSGAVGALGRVWERSHTVGGATGDVNVSDESGGRRQGAVGAPAVARDGPAPVAGGITPRRRTRTRRKLQPAERVGV